MKLLGVLSTCHQQPQAISTIVEVKASLAFTASSDSTGVIARAGARVRALTVVGASYGTNVVHVAFNIRGNEHSQTVDQAIKSAAG